MKIIGFIILVLVIIAIICMQLLSILDLKKDLKKEAQHEANIEALKIADKHYKNMIRNTNFKVVQKLVISNDSDIEWR